MGIFLILLSITLVIILVFRGVPVFYAAVIASFFCLLTAALFDGAAAAAGQGVISYVVDYMTSTGRLADPAAHNSYVFGVGNYFTSNFCIFVLGAIFGKLFDNSGAADCIATAIINKLGKKAVIPAILLVGWVLTFGGVSVFVAFFAMYPLMLSLFKEADIPRRLLPLYYFAGAGTSTGWIPGSPQPHNLLPSTALGVSPSAYLVPGLIFVVIEMIMVVWFVFWYTARAQKNGEHYEMTEADRKVFEEREAQGGASTGISVGLAVIPMIILIVVLNFTKIGVPSSLTVGILAAVICFFRFIPKGQFWKTMGDGSISGINALFNTAAIVGFGAVVQAIPGYVKLTQVLLNAFNDPYVASVVTVGGLAGVTGSGTGGIGLAMPVVIDNFLGGKAADGTILNPHGYNIGALSRLTSLAALTLDSLPHCGLVVSVISYTGNTHKSSYLPCFFVFVVAPTITVILLLLFIKFTGGML